jgi:hypothetical protein
MKWPRRAITDPCRPDAGPLMLRYFLIRSPWFAVYLHRFLRSDNDRHVHDHPWSFWTLILTRGYFEHLPDRSRHWRPPGSILFRPAEWQHWVEVPRPCWTFVVRFRKRRDWGFITSAGWVDHETYDREWCED